VNAIRSEKISAIEQDRAAVAEAEADIRDFVGGDTANLRLSASTTDTGLESSREASISGINLLIERLAGPSLTQIQNLVCELGSMREMLHAEAHRVQREISGYDQLSQATRETARMIADNVSEWKRAADGLRNG
jgi:hypothetical protein